MRKLIDSTKLNCRLILLRSERLIKFTNIHMQSN